MAAVVVAIRNKRYDAEEAEGSMFENKQLLTTFPSENERRADLIMQKYMIDGYVSDVTMLWYFDTNDAFFSSELGKVEE